MKNNNIKIFLFAIIATLFLMVPMAFAPEDMGDGPECYRGMDTNSTYCEDLSEGEYTCNWDTADPYCDVGCCIVEGFWEDFDMGADGCFSNNGNYDGCSMDSSCVWSANEMNQQPWCGIKNINDALGENADATIADVGCCESKGCWTFNGDETECTNAFGGGLCYYSGSNCEPYPCHEIEGAGAEQTCGNMIQVDAPCVWVEGACDSPGYGDGGFGFGTFVSADSCFANGGFWHFESETCNPPLGPGGGDFNGGGGFMFGGETHCYFSDGIPIVCTNMTGCGYCVEGTGPYGVSNTSEENACYGVEVGLCEGHDEWAPQGYTNVDNSANLECSDVQIKQACNCGPMPNCKWNSSAEVDGNYCMVGSKTDSQDRSCEPSIPFCEHPQAQDETNCTEMKEVYMMPCEWNSEDSKCGFNGEAVFGKDGDQDFFEIGDEGQCTAGGGTWTTEYYVEDGTLKQDSWCEKGAMFDFDTGSAFGNKGSCDNDCWACEFQSDGNDWADVSAAQISCESSDLGYCRWTNSTDAPNGLGFCDYPEEFAFGSDGDCANECGECDYMQDPETECGNSAAECQWITDEGNPSGGYCIGSEKQVCANDCFSCYGQDECADSTLSCTWDNAANVCKPENFDEEICFDGVDNDGDGNVDCGDTYCSFDNNCGGSFFGDCFKYDTDEECNNSLAFVSPAGEDVNCSWMIMPWEETGHCDMPGKNCFQFEEDSTACDAADGCTAVSFGEGEGFCDMNRTKIEEEGCFDAEDESACDGLGAGCSWIEESWDEGVGSGFCEHTIFATCSNLFDESACTAALGGPGEDVPVCTWKEDHHFEDGGKCEPACFNDSLDEASCNGHGLGFCEYRVEACEPEFFMNMGGPASGGMGGGGFATQSGCPQYDGNQTGCDENNVTCVWHRDDNSENNLSVAGESGWCNDLASFGMTGEMKDRMFAIATDGTDVVAAPNYVDLANLLIKDEPNAYVFSFELENDGNADSAACNGYPVDENNPDIRGEGDNSSKYYWYLDTDDSGDANGCCANYTLDSGEDGALCGFEFLVSYTSTFTSDTVEDTKALMKCDSGSWISTNILVTLNKHIVMANGEYEGCMYGTPLVSIEKSSLESFKALYDNTKPLRVFGTSANDTYGRTNPQDAIGAGYYTPGTDGFGFVDCNDPDVKDPKCKNFKKFGFNIFENCHGAGDEDLDGDINCEDTDCEEWPMCGGSCIFEVDDSDTQTPVVIFAQVEKESDFADIKFDTDEPANGSVMFYSDDDSCTILNTTIDDIGDATLECDDYKPFHMVNLGEESLGYALDNGTAYYYKTKVCDSSNNCGTSSCLNFTTRVQTEVREFILKMDLPDGYTVDIPAFGVEDFNFTYDADGTEYDVGIKTNTSVSKDINMTVHCGDMQLVFDGVDLKKPKSINLETAFICDEANNVMGMNSSSKSWDKVKHELSMGGSGDFLTIGFGNEYDASKDIDWCDDDAGECTSVTDYLTCGADAEGNTECDIPTSFGFSTYTVASASAGTTGTGGGGGSGGIDSITSEVIVDEPETVEVDAEGEVVADEGVVNATVEAEPESEEVSIWTWIIWAGAALAIIVLLVILFFRAH